MKLPNFSVNDYLLLIDRLRERGYEFRKVSQLVVPSSNKVVYMRHDVDINVSLIDMIAKAEASRGVTATYYLLLTHHYNLLHRDNRRVLHMLRDLGHEIGLHYDLETYPPDPEQARARLAWEVSILSSIVGMPISTISMHNPYQGRPDPFRMLDEYVHPHDPRYQDGLLYVSDSCRAWRDESLLTCFGAEPPQRLLLTTHPELWLDGTITDRMMYLDRVLIETGVRQYKDYFDKNARQIWSQHPAPRLHNERERQEV